jgi:hypothetical protein
MANVCTNQLYLQTKDKQLGNSLIEAMTEMFYCSDVQPVEDDELLWCQMEFDSRWVFPQKEMEELTKNLPKGNDLFIRVHSYELNCDYVGLNKYTDGEWCDKLAE